MTWFLSPIRVSTGASRCLSLPRRPLVVPRLPGRVRAQVGAAASGEQWAGGLAVVPGEPGVEDSDGPGRQWGDPLFSAFPEAAGVGAGFQVGVGAGQTDQFADAKPGLGHHRQQGVVTPSGPRAAVGSGEQNSVSVSVR